MKLFQNRCEFDYSWETVTTANWNKYPNSMSPHVIGVDVLRRELSDHGNILTSERLITVRQNVPRWLMLLVGCKDNLSYVREVSQINLRDKTLKMRSCNLSFVNFLRVFETVDYFPNPVDPQNKTIFQQEAQITAYGRLTKICNSMEEFSVKRFCDNAEKGQLGLEKVLDKMVNNVDNLSNNLITKYNETIEDVKRTKMYQDIERKCTILSDYYDIFNDTFSKDSRW